MKGLTIEEEIANNVKVDFLYSRKLQLRENRTMQIGE
jgi:hypothetical protein